LIADGHRATWLLAVAIAALGPWRAACADAYGDARAELVAAYGAADYAAMLSAAHRALQARPGHAGALFNLALAQVLTGDVDASLQTLGRLAAMGIDFGADAAEEFAPLREQPGWDAYIAALEAIRQPVGSAEVVAESDASDFIPEGIAVAADGRIILGSIRHGQLMLGAGRIDETTTGPFDHWSVFGMRFDAAGRLWFASSHVPQFAGKSGGTGSRAGLFRFDTGTGAVDRSARLPATGGEQVLGDLVIADDHTIYTSDSVDGPVYRYSIDAGEFATLVPAGVFGSPQGLALDPNGEYLYVADYTGGLFRVRLADAAVEKVVAPGSVNDYGIDGLYRHGRHLIAIQNGIRPQRVTEFAMSADGAAIESARILAMNLPQFDEPTLGTVVGDDFYFVANSHWNRFDADNALPGDLAGPVVLKIALR